MIFAPKCCENFIAEEKCEQNSVKKVLFLNLYWTNRDVKLKLLCEARKITQLYFLSCPTRLC